MTAAALGDDEASTERRILLAAERLFAEKGIDAVSLRSVMAEAGTNVASIHYHFGSKDALVRALILGRSGEVAARRTTLLDELAEPGRLTADGLARAFVEPVAEMAASDGASWVRLVGGIWSTGHPSLEIVVEAFMGQAKRFNKLCAELHPDWTPARQRFRLAQAMRLTFSVLGDVEGVRAMQEISAARLSRDGVVEELTTLVATILSDPKETP